MGMMDRISTAGISGGIYNLRQLYWYKFQELMNCNQELDETPIPIVLLAKNMNTSEQL